MARGDQSSPIGLLLLLGAALGFWWFSRTDKGREVMEKITEGVQQLVDGSTRGLRNNNPGNIKFAVPNNWRGQIGVDDKGFVIFDSMANGVRALGILLRNYSGMGLNTVEKIISRWSATDREPYIRNVSLWLGVNPQSPLDVNARLTELAAGIIRQENGKQPFSIEQINEWVRIV